MELDLRSVAVDDRLTVANSPSVSESSPEKFKYKSKPVYDFFKRAFDIVCSAIALIILIPFFIIIAAVIMISDRNLKPFFVQKRCGKNGKQFSFIKFRSMCVDAEAKLEALQEQNEMDGPVFKITDDPRITKVGKFIRATGIDELPQLFNIFAGQMSFVGPRPALPNEVEQYSDQDRLRLLVKPGLTCYWQVQPSRNSISFEKWMELDRKYINERSFWLDIKLMFKTALTVFHRDGC
ncbi:MAG: sugar transferase [Acutalibacteraceae bacterium]